MKRMMTKTDAELHRAVLDELAWDTRVRDTDVGVQVTGGTVTLTGKVESWAERLAAQEAARRVSGVLDVANDIQVKLPGSQERTDTDIAHAVRHALEWDVTVPHERIKATVSNGEVTLEGKVDYWSQYDDAARAVRNLTGVREVKNVITVEPSASRVSPQRVRSSIESALQRRAEHAAKKVQITIDEGQVVLSGDVMSWAERVAVEGAVRGTPGVKAVDSQLRIHG